MEPRRPDTDGAPEYDSRGRRDPNRDRIYVVGIGAIGKFLAHSIRGAPNPPPVTLLFKDREVLGAWHDKGRAISITTDNVSIPHQGFEVQEIHALARIHNQPQFRSTSYQEKNNQPIYNLLVCTKAGQVKSVLDAIHHRLRPESTICFVQNGMGVVEEVNEEFFPDPSTRPHYVLGINSHGAYNDDLFSATHAGYGTITLGLPVSSNLSIDDYETHPSRHLIRTLTSIPVLAATAASPSEVFQVQLEKLAVNAVVNPLTVIMDCRNGSLLYNYSVTRILRLIISEVSHIIRNMPELEGLPNVAQRFSPERLETLVVNTAWRTRENISSMLADVRIGRKTEAHYINGYVVKRGEEMGFPAVNNFAVMHMVIAKQMMVLRESGAGEIPVMQNWEGIVPKLAEEPERADRRS